jgi:hypothetical protein
LNITCASKEESPSMKTVNKYTEVQDKLRVATANIRSLYKTLNCHAIWQLIEKHQIEVFCLQESWVDPTKHSKIEQKGDFVVRHLFNPFKEN